MSLHDWLTPEWLYARSFERDGHLIWKLAAAHGTDPQATMIVDGVRKVVLVRRAIVEARSDKALPRTWIAFSTCDEPLCVHPDCVKAHSRGDHMRGRKLSLLHRAAVAAGKQAVGKLTRARVEDIRASDEPASILSERHHVCEEYVYQVRAHKVWKNYTTHFAGLGSR